MIFSSMSWMGLVFPIIKTLLMPFCSIPWVSLLIWFSWATHHGIAALSMIRQVTNSDLLIVCGGWGERAHATSTLSGWDIRPSSETPEIPNVPSYEVLQVAKMERKFPTHTHTYNTAHRICTVSECMAIPAGPGLGVALVLNSKQHFLFPRVSLSEKTWILFPWQPVSLSLHIF